MYRFAASAVALLACALASRADAQCANRCDGDLDADGAITVAELITAVANALDGCGPESCPGDLDADGAVSIDELVVAVNNALNGCTSLVHHRLGDRDGLGTGALPGDVIHRTDIRRDAADSPGLDEVLEGSDRTFALRFPPLPISAIAAARIVVGTWDIDDGDRGLDSTHANPPFDNKLFVDGTEIAAAFDSLDQDLLAGATANDGQGNPPVRGESGTGPTTFPLAPALLHLITDGAIDVRLDAHPLEIYAVDYVELVIQEACPE